jgi:tetratricopeptide (TPR) repeat protein
LKRDPNNVEALIKKGEALNKLGKSEEAAKCYNEALKRDPIHAVELSKQLSAQNS